jgi:cellulose synthase/poly-beta-1,6-N-acetylglucosamine synthase-like glycosyltransferase
LFQVPANVDLLTEALLFSTLAYAAAVAVLWFAHLARNGRRPWGLVVLTVYGPAAAITAFVGSPVWLSLAFLSLGIFIASVARWRLEEFTHPGVAMMVTFVQLLLVALPWGARFVATIPVSSLTRGLMLLGYPLLVLLLPVALVQTYEGLEVLWRRAWRRPRTALPPKPRARYPKVSVHVPVHAEPPDMVIATLDAIAGLTYPNLEVLVIDNNTDDPRLWKPVQAHCQRLGDRFRFFHVEGLTGAKAGALNFALRETAPDAEIVSVVDADYEVAPDFIDRLIGHFDDPRMGFVQAPHDYRAWEASPYLRACYWEYKYFFHTILVSRNERDAAITVGTMCLIRRKALEEAGGWAEWCVTEDSELAIRIHALGYTAVYLTESFGRGLIPETFRGYKRQRFRWTYGPVQELKHHVRLLLPSPLGRRSALSSAQKVHHLNHGLDRLAVGLGFLLMPVGVGVVASMLAHREVVPVPFALWLVITVLLVTGLALRFLVFWFVIGCSFRDAVYAAVASKSLSHTVTIASLRSVFTRTMPWRRTNKFKPLPSVFRALSSARTELLLGTLALGVALAVFVALPKPGLLFMLAIGAVLLSLRYFAAPTMALVAERDIRRSQARVPDPMSAWQFAWQAEKRRRIPLLGKVVLVGTAVAAMVIGVSLLVRPWDFTGRRPDALSIGGSQPPPQESGGTVRHSTGKELVAPIAFEPDSDSLVGRPAGRINGLPAPLDTETSEPALPMDPIPPSDPVPPPGMRPSEPGPPTVPAPPSEPGRSPEMPPSEPGPPPGMPPSEPRAQTAPAPSSEAGPPVATAALAIQPPPAPPSP